MAGVSKLSIEWNTKQFNGFINEFIQRTQADTSLVLRKFAFDLLTRLIARTPVDTGRARAGWTTAANALGIKVPKGKEQGSTGQYEEMLEGPHQYIRMMNDVDYVIYLEYGWSKQAPAGMLRISMAELRSGKDLTTALMEKYQEGWGELGGRARYAAQRKMLSGVLGNVKNMNLGPRRPK